MNDTEKHDVLTALENQVDEALRACEEANKADSPLRSRELSVAITHIEDGLRRLTYLRQQALRRL